VSFFQELKRRNVFRVGIAYAVVAWLLLQLTEVLTELLELNTEIGKIVILLLVIGFVPALIFAWAFELTPEGIKRESEIDRDAPSSGRTSHTLDRVIIGVLVIALGYFVYESRFKDSGEEPVASESATAGIPAAEEPAPSGVAADARSVAVLPFMNMSPDAAQEYFSDGITEEIINAVVKIPGVAVPARTTVFAYKNHQGDLREVGRELGVAHILEGSIRSQGDQVRITAQLIEVDGGFHLWSETYDRQLDNIFAVQEEIAEAIAAQLVGELDGAVDTVPNQTRNMAAYDLYLKGRAELRRRSLAANTLLEQAIEADPGFAPAYAALAISMNSTGYDNDRAIVLADQALALDPNNVDALNAKAAALRSRMQWRESEAWFERALAVDPNSAELLEDYAEFLAYTGRVEEALEVAERGINIDPALFPLRSAYFEALLSNGMAMRAREEAVEQFGNEGNPTVTWWVTAYVWLDPEVRASGLPLPLPKQLPEWDEIPKDWVLTSEIALRLLHEGPGGTLSDADIQTLKSTYGGGRFGSDLPRALLIIAGEIDHVIATDLSLFGSDDDLPLHEVQWAPHAAPLRQHPRFAEYVERAGLIDYWDAAGWPDFCRRDDAGEVRCR
jgi:TolB-like protein